MRSHRYFGRYRNAGYGYSIWQRARRELSNYVGFKLRLYWLAYWIDFDRDRYLEEFLEVAGDDDDQEEEELEEWERLEVWLGDRHVH